MGLFKMGNSAMLCVNKMDRFSYLTSVGACTGQSTPLSLLSIHR